MIMARPLGLASAAGTIVHPGNSDQPHGIRHMQDPHVMRNELNLAKKLSLAGLNAPENRMTRGIGFTASMMSAPADSRVEPEDDDTASQSPRDHDLTRMNLL